MHFSLYSFSLFPVSDKKISTSADREFTILKESLSELKSTIFQTKESD